MSLLNNTSFSITYKLQEEMGVDSVALRVRFERLFTRFKKNLLNVVLVLTNSYEANELMKRSSFIKKKNTE